MSSQQASQEYLALEVECADPIRRVALLHEGAARFTREAIRSIERRDFEQAHNAFVRAKNIILHFLSSVPEADDSDLADSLRGLLQFTYVKLVEGNVRKDPRSAQKALEVIRLLGDGWSALDAQRRPAADGERPEGVAYLG